MKNGFVNLILKTAIVVWAVFIILVLVSFVKFETPNSNSKLQTGKLDQIEPLIENESLQLIAAPTPEQTAPEYFYPMSDYERWLVESIVAGESGIEPYWGKVAVASCILNACLLEDKRPEEIQSMYGYAGWKPIEEFESECMEAYGNTDLADEVRDAVSQVFDKGEVLSNEILWFCSGYSEWHESQRFVIEIGNHRFFGSWN